VKTRLYVLRLVVSITLICCARLAEEASGVNHCSQAVSEPVNGLRWCLCCPQWPAAARVVGILYSLYIFVRQIDNQNNTATLRARAYALYAISYW